MSGRHSSQGGAIPDPAALATHIPGLRRFACALLHGDRERADDLVQDSLERALSGWHRRRVDGDLRGWIYTILYNQFASDQRRQRRRALHNSLMEAMTADLAVIDGGQEQALEHRDLVRGFADLPAEQRSVLILIGVEDFSYHEAAGILGVPIGTVMSRLSRGRERLRQFMNGGLARRRPELTMAK